MLQENKVKSLQEQLENVICGKLREYDAQLALFVVI